MQAEPPCQHVNRVLDYLLWVLAKLPIKAGVIVRVHAALENFGFIRPIKEPRRDPQRADLVTGSPSSTDFVGFTIHAVCTEQ